MQTEHIQGLKHPIPVSGIHRRHPKEPKDSQLFPHLQVPSQAFWAAGLNLHISAEKLSQAV